MKPFLNQIMRRPPLPPPALLVAVMLVTTTLTQAASVPFAWGKNDSGSVGDGSSSHRYSPVAVNTSGALSGKTVTSIASSNWAAHALAVTSDGKAYGWGENIAGQLGSGTVTPSEANPVAVTMTGVLSGKTIIAAAAGMNHSLVLTADGLLFGFGANPYGELGNNSTSATEASPVAVDMTGVLAGKTIVQISAGQHFSVAVDSNGVVYSWGANTSGQLGDNTSSTESHVPVAVDMSGALTGKIVTQVSAGQTHVLALTSDGLVFGWGDNNRGKIGDGTDTTRRAPVAVDSSGYLFGKVIVSISAGFEHSLAAASDGTAYAWGFDYPGVLGSTVVADNTESFSPAPVDMTGMLSGKSVVSVAAGTYNSYALTSDGEIFSWGYNTNYGAVGDGTTTNRSTPVAVDMSGAISGHAVTSLQAGQFFAVVLAVPSVSTITPACRFTYAANFGWLNWRTNPLATDAPVIETTMAHGKVYAANVGWIDLGDGSPSTSAGYSQTGGDIGVNHDGAGGLSGYAYGANIGWIYFDPTIAQPPRIDLVTGAFSGYAYSANCGWIFLGTIKTSIDPGPDTDPLAGGGSGDGIADSWEIEQATAAGYGSSLSLLGTNANSDFDFDGISDRDEYLADTNPFSVNDRLDITGFTVDPLTGNIDLDWNGSTRRLFRIHYSSNLSTWSPLGDVQTGGSAALTATLPLSNLFFKVEASLPLPGP